MYTSYCLYYTRILLTLYCYTIIPVYVTALPVHHITVYKLLQPHCFSLFQYNRTLLTHTIAHQSYLLFPTKWTICFSSTYTVLINWAA